MTSPVRAPQTPMLHIPLRPEPMPADKTRVVKRPVELRPAPFRYDGLELPDVTVARRWEPGKIGLDGAGANARVTDTYTQLDTAMTRYLGHPQVPNWMSFGKYASRGAGEQILRMEEILKVTHRLDADSAIDTVQDLMKNPLMLGEQGIELLKLSRGNPLAFLRNTEALHKALVFGNTGVYADLAPAYDLFLRAEAAGRDGVKTLKKVGFGVAPRDPQGLLLQSFALYQKANQLQSRIAKADAPTAQRLLDERLKLVHRANLLLGCHEQMVVLQGPQVFGDPEVSRLLSRMTTMMTLTDATGTHKLLPNGGNWADFAQRMGFVAVPEGSDPQAIKVVDHAGVASHYVLNPDLKAREGSIAQYFLDGLAPETSSKLIQSEPAPLPAHFRDGSDMRRWFDKLLDVPVDAARWLRDRFGQVGGPPSLVIGA